MDVLTHALWPYAVTVKHKRWRKWAALWGMFPDVGVLPQLYFLLSNYGTKPFRGVNDWTSVLIPASWMQPYYTTHSFVTLAAVAGLYWLWKKRWAWPLIIGWSSHILLDMFTHGGVYANRPLYPLSNFSIEGVSWADPRIFIPNVIALVLVYGYFGWRRWQRNRVVQPHG